MSDAVKQWLESPELTSGLILYEKYINNAARLFYYEQGIYSLDELIDELREFVTKSTKQSTGLPDTAKSKFPKEIQELDILAGKAWKERNYLRSIILQECDSDKRKVMAFRILECSRTSIAIWKQIDGWKATGILPQKESKKQKKQDTLLELIEKLKNIPTYLSKIDKKIKTCQDVSKQAEWVMLKNKHTEELERVKKRLQFLDEKITALCL